MRRATSSVTDGGRRANRFPGKLNAKTWTPRSNVFRRGFTIRLKRLMPRGPKFGGVRTIFSISESNYICIFVMVKRSLRFFTISVLLLSRLDT